MDTSSTSSMTTINDFPPEKLCIILDKLPLIALVHIDEVSHTWSDQKSHLFSQRKELNICKDKAALFLVETPIVDKLRLPFVMNNKILDFAKLRDRLDRNALYAKQIPPKMVDNITKLMPNLTVIRIRQEGSFIELWKIKLLLDHYRRQLVEVNIHFEGTYNAAQEHLETSKNGFRDMFLSLITTLNSLEKLDFLTLFFDIPKSCTSSIEVDLSVVRRLKKLSVMTFGFNDSFDIDVMQHTLQTYARENESLQIGSISRFRLDTLLAFGPQILAAMREVKVSHSVRSEQLDALKQLARQCPNMKTLNLSFWNLSMAQVAEALLPCRSLVCLEVSLFVDGLDFLANDLPLDQLPVLSSVDRLILFITTTSHRDLEQMQLEVIFPNLQLVILEQTLDCCLVCNFDVPEDIAQSSSAVQTAYSLLVHECQRLTRLSFAKCSKLTTLAANIGLEEISSSYKYKVFFTPKTLDRVTYIAKGELLKR